MAQKNTFKQVMTLFLSCISSYRTTSIAAFAALTGGVAALLLQGGIAHAATVYDTLLSERGEWVVKTETGTSGEKDIYSDIIQILDWSANQQGTGCIDDARDYWYANRTSNNDYWEVVKQTIAYDESEKNVIWYFGAETPTPELDTWDTTGTLYRSRVTSTSRTFILTFQYYALGDYDARVVLCTDSTGTTFSAAQYQYSGGGSGAKQLNILVSPNIPITYPASYEGNEYYTSYNTPKNNTPNIKLRSIIDWSGNFSDDNFLIIDKVPFTCEGGLAPVIHGELWDDDQEPAVLMDTFTASATALFTIEFNKVDIDRNYRIVSWYECGDGVNEFSDAAHYSFTITSYGQLEETTLLAMCIKEEFPFIDPSGCLQSLFNIINVLIMRDVSYGGGWSPGQGCKELTTIDNWIGIENPVVCPAIDDNIKLVATPIAMFLLALSTLRVLNRTEHGRE